MFKKISDVPAPISMFYHEEVRNEPVFKDDDVTPVMISKEYTYMDENGNAKTGVRDIHKHQDNTYVIENERTDLKSWDDVDRVITKAKGKNDSFIKYCVGKASEADKWAFHDNYIEWMNKCSEINEHNESLSPDANGVIPDEMPLPDEPIEPPQLSVDEWMLVNFDKLRLAAMPSTHEQMEMIFNDQMYRTNTNVTAIIAIKKQYPKKQSK